MRDKMKHLLKRAGIGCLIAAAGIILGIVLMDYVVMPLVVGKHRGHDIVPDIINLTVREAKEKLQETSLQLEMEKEDFSDLILKGHIFAQNPAAGQEVKKGRKIYYSISKGPKNIILPELRGRTLRQARIYLNNLGLSMGKVRYVFDDSLPVDIVLSSTPEAGDTLEREMTIDLIISQGQEPTEAFVPNLIGESLEKSARIIRDAGLTIGSVSRSVRKELLPETIISQSLSPGSKVSRGAEINLVVSTLD